MLRKRVQSTSGLLTTPFGTRKRAAAASATFASCWSPEIWAAVRRSKRAVRWAGARGGSPARDVYGIRVAKSEMGYKSLGASSEKVTKAQHCRAEVYLGDYGWVPLDPADVRKVVLEEPPGNRPLEDDNGQEGPRAAIRVLGMNWMAYNFAHDVALPGANGAPVAFFMYPQAETADGRLDSLDPDNFKYEITSTETTSTNG